MPILGNTFDPNFRPDAPLGGGGLGGSAGFFNTREGFGGSPGIPEGMMENPAYARWLKDYGGYRPVNLKGGMGQDMMNEMNRHYNNWMPYAPQQWIFDPDWEKEDGEDEGDPGPRMRDPRNFSVNPVSAGGLGSLLSSGFFQPINGGNSNWSPASPVAPPGGFGTFGGPAPARPGTNPWGNPMGISSFTNGGSWG